MDTLFLISFFFSSPPNTCSTHGTPMLEIRERSETSRAITTKRIYASGGWTVHNGRAMAERGCFDKKELKSIRRAVQRAPWKVTSSPIACFAYDPNFTEYVLHGRLRYTHRMCSGKTADSETMAAIDLVNNELAEEMTPPPPPPPPVVVAPPPPAPPVVMPPPVKPPVATCSASGTPLFAIHKKSDAQEPTWIKSIYGNGAWTYQEIDNAGKLGSSYTGCLDKLTLMSIRSSINNAPWDVTFSRIVCRAYSASYLEYYVHGKYEYTARLCGEQRIDDQSAAAIKLIDNELAHVLPKHAMAL